MVEESWDLIIVGGGPAGLTAGIYAARSGLKTLILERNVPGGLVKEAAIIENYPGFPEGIQGFDLVEKIVKQCEASGVEIRSMEKALEMELTNENKHVKTEIGTYSATSVIIATGTEHKHLGVPGEREFQGRGVSYCAVCDGPLFKEKSLIVVGGGNCAAINALFLSNLASNVRLVHRRSSFRAENALVEQMVRNGVKFILDTEIRKIVGDEIVRRVVLYNNKTGDVSEIEADGVFIEVGQVPLSEVAKEAGVEVDKRGYILVDSRQRTNIEGVYAIGDVTTCPHKQIGTAVGHAVISAIEAFGYIKRPYYHKQCVCSRALEMVSEPEVHLVSFQ